MCICPRRLHNRRYKTICRGSVLRTALPLTAVMDGDASVMSFYCERFVRTTRGRSGCKSISPRRKSQQDFRQGQTPLPFQNPLHPQSLEYPSSSRQTACQGTPCTRSKELQRWLPYIGSNELDDNHKPEMTIALTPFAGFCGFRPLNEISHFLSTVPELSDLLGPSAQTFQESFATSSAAGKDALKTLFTALMNSKPDDIAVQAELLIDRAKNNGTLGDNEGLAQLLVELDLQFPKDIGLFCAFFLNYVKLNPGEAMFLKARDVHAYISGGLAFFNRTKDRYCRVYGCFG